MNLRIITNEVIVAESILDGSYDGKLSKGKIVFLLAKYYLHHCNMDDVKVRENLHGYMGSVTDFYIWEMNDDYIRSVTRKASKSKLVEINKVIIYESEIEQIRKAKNLIQEKVLFSYLVHAKIKYKIKEETNGWVNNTSKEIFDSVGINYTSKRRSFIEKELIDKGYLTPTVSLKNNTKQVNYMSLTGKVFYEITNFEQLDLQYEMITGVSEVINCEVCSCLIRKKSNKTKYCKPCGRVVNIEKTINNRKSLK